MTIPQQPPVSEQVARELHANGVHSKCPPECWTRWDASGHDTVDGSVPSTAYPWAPAAPAASKSRRRLFLMGAAVVVVLAGLVIGGLALFSGGPTAQQLTIKFSLFDATGDGGNCATGGRGGYTDIQPGMPVTVKDETGKVLASTELPATGEDAKGIGCIWTMHVLVSNGAQQYGVEAGRRGTVTYSKQEMVAKHWVVETGIS